VFTTFCLLAMLLAAQYVSGRQKWWWSTAMCLVLTFAVFTRSIGVVLVVTVLAYLLVVKGQGLWKQVALIAAQTAALLGLIVVLTPIQLKDLPPVEYLKDGNARLLLALFNGGSPDGSPADASSAAASPTVPAADSGDRVNMMLDLLSFSFRQHFGYDIRGIALPIGGGTREQKFANSIGIPWLPDLSGFVISALVIAGVIRGLVREGPSLFLTFGVVYFGVLFLWVWNDPRLLYPIIPQIHLGFLLALDAIVTWIIRRFAPPFPSIDFRRLVLAAALLVAVVLLTVRGLQKEGSRLHVGDLQVRTNWINANVPPSAVIMTAAPAVDYLYSGRKTVAYPSPSFSSDQLASYLWDHGVNYILVAPAIQWQEHYVPSYTDETVHLLEVIEGLVGQGRLQLAFSQDRDLVKVFQILPPDSHVGEVRQR
jgi:hypothetical protein